MNSGKTEIKEIHEHGVQSFKAYFRGVLVDEFETWDEADETIRTLELKFYAGVNHARGKNKEN